MSGGLLQSKPCVKFFDVYTNDIHQTFVCKISHSPSKFEVMLSSKQSMYNLTTTTKEKSKWKKHVGNQGL